MSLIVAIEPDRRQASRVAALARARLKAELLVADSTEQAVALLGGRVPELVLTSLLLSTKDEAALRELHNLGPHVQTLTIPVLAGGTTRSASRTGLLKRLPWSREDDDASVDGCAPDVFASQIEEYLERARLEREDLAEPQAERVAASAAPDVDATVPEETPEVDQLDPLEFIGHASSEHALPPFEPMALEPSEPLALLQPLERLELLEPFEPLAALEPLEPLELLEPREPEEPFAPGEPFALGEPIGGLNALNLEWNEIPLDDDPPTLDFLDTAMDLQEFVQELERAAARQVDAERSQVETTLLEADSELAVAVARNEPRFADSVPLTRIASWPALEGELATEDARPEPVESATLLVTEDEPSSDTEPDSDLWMPLAATAPPLWPRLDAAVAARRRPERAIQDEWGLFDPARCGFSALLEKLDAMSK